MSDEVVKRDTVAPSASIAPRESSGIQRVRAREFLGFVIDEAIYALPLQAVREILKVPPVTDVPRAPEDVLGVISVRGRITTVVDLRRRLRVEARPTDKHSRVLLVDSGDEIIGLLVDEVLQVYRLADDEIEFAGVVGSDLSEHVLGIGRPRARGAREREGVEDPNEILILLDPGPLLRR